MARPPRSRSRAAMTTGATSFAAMAAVAFSWLLSVADAGDACCKAEAARRALVPNPFAVKPSHWDDEDDGPWEAPRIPMSDLPGRYRLGHEIRLGLAGAAPWLLVGVVAAALLTTVMKPLVPSSAIRSWLGSSGQRKSRGDGNSNSNNSNSNSNSNSSSRLSDAVWDSVRGSLFGLLVPFCSCGALPLAMALSKEGVSPSSIAAFVTAAQAAGVDSLFFTYGVFGARVALFRMLAAGVLAFLVGLTLASHSHSHSHSHNNSDSIGNQTETGTEREGGPGSCCNSSNGADACSDTPDAGSKAASGPASLLLDFVRTALELFASVSVWVFLGVLVSACETIWAPSAAAVAATSGSSASVVQSLVTRAGLFLLAIPMTICEHGIVSLVDALRGVGISAGTAAALVVTGPATNVGTLLVLSRLVNDPANPESETEKNHRIVATVKIAAVVVLFGIGLSYWTDHVGASIAAAKPEHAAGGGSALPEWLNEHAVSLAGLFTVASMLQSSSWLLRSSSSSSCSK